MPDITENDGRVNNITVTFSETALKTVRSGAYSASNSIAYTHRARELVASSNPKLLPFVGEAPGRPSKKRKLHHDQSDPEASPTDADDPGDDNDEDDIFFSPDGSEDEGGGSSRKTRPPGANGSGAPQSEPPPPPSDRRGAQLGENSKSPNSDSGCNEWERRIQEVQGSEADAIEKKRLITDILAQFVLNSSLTLSCEG